MARAALPLCRLLMDAETRAVEDAPGSVSLIKTHNGLAISECAGSLQPDCSC